MGSWERRGKGKGEEEKDVGSGMEGWHGRMWWRYISGYVKGSVGCVLINKLVSDQI